MHSFSLLPRTFPRILVSKGSSEMERYDETTLGPWPGFGISEMLALHKVGSSLEVSLEWFNMHKNRDDILESNTLKNSILKPSGSAAILLGKEITFLISSRKTFIDFFWIHL